MDNSVFNINAEHYVKCPIGNMITINNIILYLTI